MDPGAIECPVTYPGADRFWLALLESRLAAFSQMVFLHGFAVVLNDDSICVFGYNLLHYIIPPNASVDAMSS